MYVGLGVAFAFFVAGITWEFLYRRPKISECFCTILICIITLCLPNLIFFFVTHLYFFPLLITGNQRMQFAPKGTTYSVSDEEVKLHPCDNSNHSTLDNMIAEYQMFHDRWIEGLKKFRDKEVAADPAANGNTEMVAV